MLHKISIVLFTAAISLFTSLSVHAMTWDMGNEYSSILNPAGVWTYGWEQTLNSTINVFDSAPTPAYQAWYDSNHNDPQYHTPLLGKGNEVSVHPGLDNSFSVVRWTSPIAGQVKIDGYFGAGDIGWMSYYISENGVIAYQWLSDPGTEVFSYYKTVAIGDTIDFIVGPQIGGTVGYGSTPVAATIVTQSASVPEPSTFLLTLAGLAGLAAIVRKTRK